MRRVFFWKSGESRLIFDSTTELVKCGSWKASHAPRGGAVLRQYKLIPASCADDADECDFASYPMER